MKWDELLNEVLKAGTGLGSAMLTPFDALKLIEAGKALNLFIVSVEVYELKDQLEIPQIDLSLYNICNEKAIYSLPSEEKSMACRLAFNDLLEKLETEKRQFGFRIWLED